MLLSLIARVEPLPNGGGIVSSAGTFGIRVLSLAGFTYRTSIHLRE
jgi:hypothetical protein